MRVVAVLVVGLLAGCEPTSGVRAAVDAGFPSVDVAIDAPIADAVAADMGPTCAAPVDAAPGCGAAAPVVMAGPTPGMMRVPAGPFWRGCNPERAARCQRDEMPGACVGMSAFEIDRTEVTQGAWAACVAAGSCVDTLARSDASCGYAPTTTPDLPMACVAWGEAAAYCAWRGARLPTEAEWEKAARGVDGRDYPWGDDAPSCDRANYSACGQRPRDVGTASAPSPYGVYDMAGNVWEWVEDTYDMAGYGSLPRCDPAERNAGGPRSRIGRGGGFEPLPVLDDPAVFLRAAFRHPIQGSIARRGIGFRCARSLDP